MSAGYAARLRAYPNKGVCGLVELKETARSYQLKLHQLVALVRQSRHTVVLTGAGISTAAGIPDFRGPQGIWTLEQQDQKKKRQPRKRQRDTVALDTAPAPVPAPDARTEAPTKVSSSTDPSVASSSPIMDFASAQPTLTHDCLTRLVRDGIIHFVVTQNVDGLHRRSGLSRNHHAILHGCAFTETCRSCHTEHFRDDDVGGMSFQPTGRTCDVCPDGVLCDTLLDWDDALPVDDLERSERHLDRADLAVCLGTSLRIQPAGSLPLRAKQLVIVNLQSTPLDAHAPLVIHERVDTVLQDVMEQLGYDTADWTSPLHRPPVERLWNMKDDATDLDAA